mmetsp:Transcript_79928/g.232027  ORF Transcript_79928/g.232027 Transcript_79928/m.232027 type:complete len:259 (+) Transcript_79928:91-867(+)
MGNKRWLTSARSTRCGASCESHEREAVHPGIRRDKVRLDRSDRVRKECGPGRRPVVHGAPLRAVQLHHPAGGRPHEGHEVVVQWGSVARWACCLRAAILGSIVRRRLQALRCQQRSTAGLRSLFPMRVHEGLQRSVSSHLHDMARVAQSMEASDRSASVTKVRHLPHKEQILLRSFKSALKGSVLLPSCGIYPGGARKQQDQGPHWLRHQLEELLVEPENVHELPIFRQADSPGEGSEDVRIRFQRKPSSAFVLGFGT